MGILICLIILAIASYVFSDHGDNYGWISLFILIAIVLFIYIPAIPAVRAANNEYVKFLYDIDSSQIENVKNQSISTSERENLLKIVTDTNSKICTNKLYYNNFWIGIFYSKEISDLKLLDYKEIPFANPTITITK
jgi:hypothetical protein